MAHSEVDLDFHNDSEADFAERLRLNQQRLIFDARFCRCNRLLHFIAGRILGDPEQAQKAVENCHRSASARAPQFEYEGAFRSWLVRVLIDEALVLLRQSVPTPTPNVLCESGPAQVFQGSDVSDGKGDIRSNDQSGHFSQAFSMAPE